ncbi:hypothetical protein SAMN05216382_0965 [Sphingomonas palmae]|uniref:Uncharacterized protein n=1 Tax=Sphingomonas palmae TaxID=1855283 RepID=A0A1H7J9Z7_9SPHN|nr:hypothetical protein SAMN05216382_0965 [Sphingomonas palmae]
MSVGRGLFDADRRGGSGGGGGRDGIVLFVVRLGSGGGGGVGLFVAGGLVRRAGGGLDVGGGVVAFLLVLDARAGGLGEPSVAHPGFGDVADGGVDAMGFLDLVDLFLVEFAFVVGVAPFAGLRA